MLEVKNDYDCKIAEKDLRIAELEDKLNALTMAYGIRGFSE